jgi:hypothetical protein
MTTMRGMATLADARSLGRKIADLGAGLPAAERNLLTALLRQALRAPDEDVRGFVADDGGPDGHQFADHDWWRLAPLNQDWLDAHSDVQQLA